MHASAGRRVGAWSVSAGGIRTGTTGPAIGGGKPRTRSCPQSPSRWRSRSRGRLGSHSRPGSVGSCQIEPHMRATPQRCSRARRETPAPRDNAARGQLERGRGPAGPENDSRRMRRRKDAPARGHRALAGARAGRCSRARRERCSRAPHTGRPSSRPSWARRPTSGTPARTGPTPSSRGARILAAVAAATPLNCFHG